MRKLIADSGSTKTDWRLIEEDGNSCTFRTKGMNPFFRTGEHMLQELQEKVFREAGRQPDKIFFYGAGIVDQEKGDVIKKVLLQLFPGASVEACSDVLGASRSLFGHHAGIACILGTGSNACLYNGEQITVKVPPLGFILGDECSGAVLGRKLIGDYYKQVMPQPLRALFESQFAMDQAEVLNRVYRTERPNKYLAGFAPFLSQHITDPYCQDLIRESLVEFFERNILKIPDARDYPIGFVGSVAFHFREFIAALTAEYGFKQYQILKEPITGLVEYHKN